MIENKTIQANMLLTIVKKELHNNESLCMDSPDDRNVLAWNLMRALHKAGVRVLGAKDLGA